MKVNGEAIDLEREYTVAATTYILLNGGDGFTMFKGCEKVSEDGLPSDADMLIQYLIEDLDGVVSKAQYGNKNGEGRIKIVAKEEEVYNYLKVEGISVNKSNADDILGDGTASYDLETNTLILENSDISTAKESKNYPVYAKGDLNIVLKGANRLSSDYYYGIAIVDPENADSINVTISGDGSLDSYGSDGGIFVKGSLTINGDVNVNGTCGEVASGSAYGIRVNNDLTLAGNAKVSAKAGSAPQNSYGTYVGDNFTACENAQLDTNGGKGTERSGGLYAISNIYVKDNAKVTTIGADNSESSNYASESYGIRTTHMYVSGGTLTATGQGATGNSHGIYTQDFELSGGTVNAQSVDAVNGQSIALQSITTFVVTNGTLNAASGDTTSDSWGIDASNTMEVSGGIINVTTGHGDRAYGISSEKITVSGGTINVNAKSADSQIRAIRSMNELLISGGTVGVIVGDTENQSYGLQASTTLEITGGKVFVEKGSASRGAAVYAAGELNIADAEVRVISQGNGIYAPYGSVNVECTEVTASEDRPLLLGTRVEVDAKGYAVYGQQSVAVSENLTIETPENGIITQVQTEEGESYSYISSEDGTAPEKVKIVPLGYSVLIKGLSFDMEVIVPAGESVNEAYAEELGVDDFEEYLDTEKEGYIFKGFYTDEKCTEGNEYSFDTSVTEDITIYAKWVEKESSDLLSDSGKPENDKVDADDADDTDDTVNHKNVKTGDDAKIGVLAALCIVMLIVIAVLSKRNRMK